MSQDEAARPPYPPSPYPPPPSGSAPDLAQARGHVAFLAAASRLGPTPAAGTGLGAGASAPQARLAMLAVRLDRFAHASLPLGPALSDKLRTRILERARAVLPAGTLLQWLGDADLAIATPLHGGEPEALRLARAVADTLARPVAVGGFELFLSCSIGAALAEVGCPAERCLQRAVDTMLGVARRGGDAIASAGSVAPPPLPAAMLAALPQALERGEFAINLQPRARLNAAGVDSYTVRLRWQSAAFGRVAPQDFLPALEALGLMGDVARWILNDALPLLAAASFPAPVQFHFPAPSAQLHREHLIEELGAAIGRLGVQGTNICIEVPCADAVRASDLLGARFEVLRRAGVQLALGDFTDTEICRDALALLRPDLVTLDARQLGSPAQGPEVAARLRAACALARDAGYGACAKGIETRPQLDEVRRWGCTSMQGYLLAQPFPARWLPQIHAALDQRARELLAAPGGG